MQVSLNANPPFFEILNPNTLNFTLAEQTMLNRIQSDEMADVIWHINIKPIHNYITGQTLAIDLPGNEGSVYLMADYVVSQPNGEYYWSGADPNGSVAQIGKYEHGYSGRIYDAATGNEYGIFNLSSEKQVLVKYNGTVLQLQGDCANGPDDDDDTDGEVEDRSGCPNNNIRVLVLYTAGALTTPRNPFVVGPQIVSELNSASLASGLNSFAVSFSLAGVFLLPGFVETFDDIKGDVNALANNTTAQALRDANLADIVILLTTSSYPGFGGYAKGIKVKNQNAYCIATITAAATRFTGAHEIGHLLGCRHQRCSNCNNSCDPSLSNNHGYGVKDASDVIAFGTIMYVRTCDKTRILRWSSDTELFMGSETGNFWNKNAEKISDRAGTVACFRAAPPPFDNQIYLVGPHYVCFGDDDALYNVTYTASAFAPPVTIAWERSENGIWPWFTTNCNSNLCLITGIDNFPSTFYVRVTVTGADGATATDVRKVVKRECAGGGGGERSVADSPEFGVFPNPTTGLITITGLKQSTLAVLTDVNGSAVLSKVLEAGSTSLEMGNLPSGTYFLSLRNEQFFTKTKLIKL